jgi:transposase
MNTITNSTPTAAPTTAALSPEPDLVAFVAIDWADQKHALVLLPAGSQTKETFTLEHTPEVLADWVAQLLARFPQGHIAVILEQSRGALLYALLPHERLQLYPINPKTSAKFREAFYGSGAKDDPLDADLMLDILLHHRERLKAWHPDEPITRQLQLLVEARRRFVADQVRLSNRLGSALKSYFPQALTLVGENLASPMACAFLQKWPTLEAAQKIRPHLLRKFYYAHQCRSEELIQQRLHLLAQAQPLTTDAAVVLAQSLQAQSVARELATLPAIVAEYDRRIADLFAQHADFAIWDSFPGAGEALAPRLAAAWKWRAPRCALVPGPSATTSSRSNAATDATPRSALWPSSGSALCGAAGNNGSPMRTPTMSRACSAAPALSTPNCSLPLPPTFVNNSFKI